jgi:hypothetical protein
VADLTVDTNNKRVVVQWADDKGDLVPAPSDALAQFTSSDVSVLRLQPEDSQWTQKVIPVAPGTATINLAIINGLGQPYADAEGKPIQPAPVHVTVGPGAAESASISISDEPPQPLQPATPGTVAGAVDPNAPGAAAALAADQQATGGPATPVPPTPTPAPTPEVPLAPDGAPAAAAGSAPTPPPAQIAGGPTGQAAPTPGTPAADTGTAADQQPQPTDDAAAPGGAPPEAEGGGGSSASSTPAEGAGAGDTGTPPPAPAPTPGKPLYLHTGAGEFDTTAWMASGLQTQDGQPLFTFASDEPGTTATGASAEWTPFTGETQPVTPPPA